MELTYAHVVALSRYAGDYIPTSILSRWRSESDVCGKNSFPGKGNPKLTDQQREIAELKKRLRDAELERDILKKATAIFS
jgi:transposase